MTGFVQTAVVDGWRGAALPPVIRSSCFKRTRENKAVKYVHVDYRALKYFFKLDINLSLLRQNLQIYLLIFFSISSVCHYVVKKAY